MIAIICVELEYLFQNTKMYFWFYLWPLYHYIIYIKQIISSCTLPGTWMAKSFYILCTLKCCTCKIAPNSSLWQSYPWKALQSGHTGAYGMVLLCMQGLTRSMYLWMRKKAFSCKMGLYIYEIVRFD